MTVSLRERRRQMLRDDILNATHALMSEKGYAVMSMDEVATQVGISKPTLYSYFSTKDDLIIATVMRDMQQLIDIIEVEKAGKTPLQCLTRVLQTFLRCQIDEGTMTLRPWQQEIFYFICEHEETFEMIQQIDAAIVALIHQAIEQNEIDPALDPATVVRAFYAMTNALNVGHKSKGGMLNPSTCADMLTAIFERGVRGRG